MSHGIEARLRGSKGDFLLDVSFEVPSQGVTVLFGRSGSGKTTLLRSLAGLERMSGRLRVNNLAWQDSERDQFVVAERRRVGYVFQEAALFPHLTVEGNLEFAARRAERPANVSRGSVVTWLELAHLLHRRPQTLSGGERQRVAIARALMTNPVVLLMDEPVSALDSRGRAEVLQHLSTLRRKLEIPTVIVTHAIEEVTRLADRVIWLDDGRVRAVGDPLELFGQLEIATLLGEEASALIDARVEHHDEVAHLTELECTWGPVTLPRLAAEAKEVVRLRVRASDVSIGLERETKSSILNVFDAVVQQIVEDSPGQVLVRCVHPEQETRALLARVTARSVDQLRLRPGLRVFLRVKGVSVR